MNTATNTQNDEFTMPATCVDDYDGKFCLADEFRSRLRDICTMQGMRDVTDRILVYLDLASLKPGPACTVSQIPNETRDLLLQLTGHKFDVRFTLRNQALSDFREAQVSQALYHGLRHLIWNDKTGRVEVNPIHDIEAWAEQLPYIEGNGFREDSPNLFNEPITQNTTVAEKQQGTHPILKVCGE